MVLSFAIVSFLSLAAFRAKRHSVIATIVLLVFMAFLFTNLQWTDDSFAYNYVYEQISSDKNIFEVYANGTYGIDFGFLLVGKLICFFAPNYTLFRTSVFLIGMLLIYLGAVRIEKCLGERTITLIPLAFYLIFPFGYDCYQIEFFLAYSVVFLGFSFLLTKAKRRHLVFIICVSIATFLHKYCFPFFIFTFFSIKWKNISYLLLLFVGILTLANFAVRINPIAILKDFFPSYYAFNSYSSDSLNPLTVLLSISIFIVALFYSYVVRNDSMVSRNIFILNLISVVFLFFIFSSLNFERYLRPVMIANYINICFSLRAKQERLKKEALSLFLLSLLIFRFVITFSDLLLK